MATKSFLTYDDYFNDWYESFLQLIDTAAKKEEIFKEIKAIIEKDLIAEELI